MVGTAGIGYCRLIIEGARGETVRDDDDLVAICRSGADILTVNLVANIITFAYRLEATSFDPDRRLLNFTNETLNLRPQAATPGYGSCS
jgi:hypothetical protein